MRSTAYLSASGTALAAALIATMYRDAFREIFDAPALRAGAAICVMAVVALLAVGTRHSQSRVACSTAALGLTVLLLVWTINIARNIVALYRLEGAVAYACAVDSHATANDLSRLTSVRLPAGTFFECQDGHRHTVTSRPFAGTAFFSFAVWSYDYDSARFILTD